MSEQKLSEKEIYENEVDRLTELYKDDIIELRQRLNELRMEHGIVGW